MKRQSKRSNSAIYLFDSVIFVLLIILTLISCKKDEEEVVDQERNILFYENFDNNDNNWPIAEDSVVKTSIENGKFYLEHKIEDINAYYYLYLNKILNNEYTIETSLYFIEGAEDFIYGLIWFRKNSFNHYYLYFNENRFLIGYIYNYNHHLVSEWTVSESINLNGKENKIKLIISGNHFDLYINNDFVFEHDAGAAIGEKVGFKVRSKGRIAIDDIMIYW